MYAIECVVLGTDGSGRFGKWKYLYKLYDSSPLCGKTLDMNIAAPVFGQIYGPKICFSLLLGTAHEWYRIATCKFIPYIYIKQTLINLVI